MATEPRTDDAVRDDAVRKLAVALAATAAMAHCDVALAADAAAEVAAASGFWGLAPVVWLKSGWTGFTGLLASPEAKDIYVYTIKTLISWGVPAVTVGIVAFFVIGSSRKNKSGADKPGGAFSLFGGGRAGEKPSPFVIKRLNDRLDSYSYAFDQAVIGKEAVDAAKRRTAFADKYAAVLGKLTAKEREAVTAAKQQWAREDARLRAEMASLSRKIRADAVRAAEGKKKNKGDDDKAEASEASDAALDKSPRLCLGLERCSACKSASPFSNDDIPETPRIFDDNGRTCCRDSGIVFITCEPCCLDTGRADQGRAAFFLGPLRCVGDSEPFSSFRISASRWAFCSPEAVAQSRRNSLSSMSRWSRGKLRPCGTGNW